MIRVLAAWILLALLRQESPNLKPPADLPAAALEADKKGLALLEAYKKDYKERKLVDQAIDEFKKAEKLAGKTFALSAYHLGIAYQHDENYKEARQKLERCLELKPEFHEAMVELGDTYVWLKSYDTAVKTYDRAIALKGDYADAHRNKGIACMRKGDFSGAQKALARAQALNGQDGMTLSLRKIVDKEVEGPKFAKEIKKETTHFSIQSNCEQNFVDGVAKHIELIYAKYNSIFPPISKTKDKFRVIVFSTVQEYLDYGSPPRTGGYYMDFTRKLVLWKQAKESDTLNVLYHEAFHQFLAYYLDHAPQWFNEGHGDYFAPSHFNASNRQMEIRTNPWRLGLIQAAANAGEYQPFPRIMQMSKGEMYDPRTVSVNYAQAWSMVYFFWHYQNGKYARLMADYFRYLMKEEDIKGAYESIFGKLNMAQIEGEWRSFVLSLR